jgi:hypothetical protein
LKELPVDLGGIAVVDIGAVHDSMAKDQDAHEKWLEKLLYGGSGDPVAIYTWKPTKTEIPVVESGFGDGAYPLYPLKIDNKTVGLEVEFIHADSFYPF